MFRGFLTSSRLIVRTLNQTNAIQALIYPMSRIMSTSTTSTATQSIQLPPNLRLADVTPLMPPTPKPPKDLDLSKFELWICDLMTNQKLEKANLEQSVFGVPAYRDIVNSVVRCQRAKMRAGTAKSKTISEISGSGRKVRPQKGSGRARAGHSRPPHWKGGVKAHGPKPRDYSFKLNKKVIALGLKVVLSAKYRESKLFIVNDLITETHKTKVLADICEQRGWKSVVFITGPETNENFKRASENLMNSKTLSCKKANVYDLMLKEKIVMSCSALQFFNDTLKTNMVY